MGNVPRPPSLANQASAPLFLNHDQACSLVHSLAMLRPLPAGVHKCYASQCNHWACRLDFLFAFPWDVPRRFRGKCSKLVVLVFHRYF